MVKYISSDSKALIFGMRKNIEIAEGITKKLIVGSSHLIQVVDSEILSGAAYTAAQGMFKDIIIPVIENMDVAIESIQEELVKYESADSSINTWDVIDDAIQENLIQSYQSQIETIDYQIDCSISAATKGALTGGALESIVSSNQKLRDLRQSLEEKMIEEQEKLNTLMNFQSDTSELFHDSLSKLKIGLQSIEVIRSLIVNPETGSYKLPDGFDPSWFTTLKSESVEDVQRKAALENSMNELNLTQEGREYYKKIMEDVLKEVPADQWASKIQELNELILFDGEGNILAIEPTTYGTASLHLAVFKNGKIDDELTKIANDELNDAKWTNLKENLPQIITGVSTLLSGVVVLGLDLSGTYFSGGTLALAGVTQAGAVAGGTMTSAGALILVDSIQKIGVAIGDINFSFTKNCNDQKNSSNKMLGENGTQVTSQTTWKNGKTERIDVENPSPGNRPGDVHYHEPNNTKWRYDVENKTFIDYITGEPAPAKIQKLLENPQIQQGIEKALKYLGE